MSDLLPRADLKGLVVELRNRADLADPWKGNLPVVAIPPYLVREAADQIEALLAKVNA